MFFYLSCILLCFILKAEQVTRITITFLFNLYIFFLEVTVSLYHIFMFKKILKYVVCALKTLKSSLPCIKELLKEINLPYLIGLMFNSKN